MSVQDGPPATERGWWAGNRLALVLLVPLLGAVWWTVGDTFREGWLAEQPRIAVAPSDDGWATVGETSVRLDALTRVDEIESDFGGDPWVAPRGYTAWRTALDVRSTAQEIRYCEAQLVDEAGRLYGIPDRAPSLPGYVASTFGCGLLTEEEAGAPTESVFVLPSDVEPVAVRITSSWQGSSGLGPRFFLLPAR